MKIYYNPKLKQLARELRNNSTLAEIMLWNELKGRKLRGYRFMRQKPIGEYIVDFFCSKLKLIIEIDGESHIGKEDYDRQRQQDLEDLGLTFLRFDDLEVRYNLDRVIQTIENRVQEIETTGLDHQRNRKG
jgi:very-short-patch-repair endonuclease